MDADIDLLVKNFKQLLKSGRSAHLDVDCHAGQAWIGLHVRIGHVHDHEHGPRTRNGPSRQRRCIRRAAARQQAAEEASAVSSNAEKATTDIVLTKNLDVTEEVTETKIEEINDEIELTEISVKGEEECVVDNMVKIEGVFKNPNIKPWTKLDPEKEVKLMWNLIKYESEKIGIEGIGEASATFEHCFEFWGTWKIKKPGLKLKYLQNSENWSKGIRITEVKHA